MIKHIKNEKYLVGGQYSQGIIAGDFLFTCGHIPYNPDTGELANNDMKEETRQVLKNLDNLAKLAGTSIKNAVKLGVFLTDMSLFKEYNEAYSEFFPNKNLAPTRTTVQVGPLLRDVHIEIDAIIFLGNSD